MLKGLAERRYNYLAVVWISMAALAMRDHRWLAVVVTVAVGAALSALFEVLVDQGSGG